MRMYKGIEVYAENTADLNTIKKHIDSLSMSGHISQIYNYKGFIIIKDWVLGKIVINDNDCVVCFHALGAAQKWIDRHAI